MTRSQRRFFINLLRFTSFFVFFFVVVVVVVLSGFSFTNIRESGQQWKVEGI